LPKGLVNCTWIVCPGLLLSLLSLNAAANTSTYTTYGVDPDFGGPIDITGYSSVYVGSQWVTTVTCFEFVRHAEFLRYQILGQFIWDTSTGTALALTWDNSAGTWGRVSSPDNYSVASVTGGGLSMFPMSNADTPLSYTPASPGSETAYLTSG